MRRKWRHVSLAATILASPLSGGGHPVTEPDVAAWNGSHPYYVLVWRNAIPGQRDTYDLRSRVIARDGRPAGDPVRVLDPGPDHKAYNPRIALSPVDGSFMMVWVDRRRAKGGDPGSWQVRVRKLDPRGRPLGDSHAVSDPQLKRIRNPRIVWGRSSNAYFGVVWRPGTRRIAGRVVRYDGRARGHVVEIARGASNVPRRGSNVSRPSLTGNKAGWFAVAWTLPYASRQAIYVRQFRAQGLRPVHRVPGVSVRGLLTSPGRHVRARAFEPAINFDDKRLQDRLAWTVLVESRRHEEAGAVAAVPLDETTHERVAKPVLLERDRADSGLPFEPRAFARDRAPTFDVVWLRFHREATACIDSVIAHRRVTAPWRAVGERPEILSSPTDPAGPPDELSCRPGPNHPELAGTYADPPNTLYVWESDPYIVGVVR
jgi:hypothetical protein